jgi:hypothetical protein
LITTTFGSKPFSGAALLLRFKKQITRAAKVRCEIVLRPGVRVRVLFVLFPRVLFQGSSPILLVFKAQRIASPPASLLFLLFALLRSSSKIKIDRTDAYIIFNVIDSGSSSSDKSRPYRYVASSIRSGLSICSISSAPASQSQRCRQIDFSFAIRLAFHRKRLKSKSILMSDGQHRLGCASAESALRFHSRQDL